MQLQRTLDDLTPPTMMTVRVQAATQVVMTNHAAAPLMLAPGLVRLPPVLLLLAAEGAAMRLVVKLGKAEAPEALAEAGAVCEQAQGSVLPVFVGSAHEHEHALAPARL